MGNLESVFKLLKIDDILRRDLQKDDVFYLLHGVVLSTTILFAVIYFIFDFTFGAISNTLLMFALISNVVFYFFTKRYILLIHLSAVYCYLNILNVILATGGWQSPTLIWLITIPVGILFWTTPITLALWSILLIVTLFVLTYIYPVGIKGIVAISQLEVFNIIHVLSYSTVTLLLASWMYFFIKRTARSLKERDEAKQQITELLRMIVHDINNPLQVIRTAEHLISRDIQNNRIPQTRHLELMVKATGAIETFIATIREVNALESGKKILHLEAINLRDLVSETLLFFEERCKEKKLRLEIIERSSPVIARVDRATFTLQVLSNILSNAIKFSFEGGIIVISIDRAGDEAIVAIKDSGIGISKALIGNIFSFTHKTTRLGTKGEGGTGFGMPLVNSLIKQMHGEISITSRPIEESPNEHGTTIFLRFPIAKNFK